MKRLLLLRHAKSEQYLNGVDDFDRPLNQRGINAASFMGELIVREKLIPDLIVSSSAKRTLQTADIVKESSGVNARVIYEDRIYEARVATILGVLSEISEPADVLLLVGHNPGMEGVVYSLTGVVEPMPTAALAVIDLAINDWSEMPKEGKLVHVFRPKDEMRRTLQVK